MIVSSKATQQRWLGYGQLMLTIAKYGVASNSTPPNTSNKLNIITQ